MNAKSSLLRYKAYTGSIEASVEDQCLHGRIQHIDDVITYEGQTVQELNRHFEIAVDEYLAHCASIGKEPQRQYGGTFNVRIGPELHKWINAFAVDHRMSVNEAVCAAIESFRGRAMGITGTNTLTAGPEAAPVRIGTSVASKVVSPSHAAYIGVKASRIQDYFGAMILTTGWSPADYDWPDLQRGHGVIFDASRTVQMHSGGYPLESPQVEIVQTGSNAPTYSLHDARFRLPA